MLLTWTGLLQVAPLSVERDNEDVAAASIKVVPGNVHSPEEGRAWVVIRPARLPVVAAAVVNAEMGPAIWVHRAWWTCIRRCLQPPQPRRSRW